jgi:hypothetical protein
MKPTFIILLILILAIPVFGQTDIPEMKPSFTDRLIFGGGLGLQFGTVTFIDVSPVVGYRITEKLEAGIGATYKYYKYNDFYVDATTGQKIDLKSHMFGGSIYTRYHLLKNLFAHVEYERLKYNYDDIYSSGGQIIRDPIHTYINSLFVGGGLRQQISANSYLFIMALWNLTEEPLSPYSNPVIRMGVLLGR